MSNSSSRVTAVVALCAALMLTTSATAEPTKPCAARGTIAASGTDPQVCLSCHDGTIARNVASPMGSKTMLMSSTSLSLHGARSGMHPVNVDYTFVYFRKANKFIHPQMLDSRVKLYKGQVTCTSCHNLESNEKSSLVMSNRGSALCLSCHNM